MTPQGLPDESIYGGTKANWRAVVKGDHKLVVGVSQSQQIPTKLYNLKDDPYELNNLVNDVAYADTREDLLAEIQMWKTKTSDPFPQTPPDAEKFYD